MKNGDIFSDIFVISIVMALIGLFVGMGLILFAIIS